MNNNENSEIWKFVSKIALSKKTRTISPYKKSYEETGTGKKRIQIENRQSNKQPKRQKDGQRLERRENSTTTILQYM